MFSMSRALIFDAPQGARADPASLIFPSRPAIALHSPPLLVLCAPEVKPQSNCLVFPSQPPAPCPPEILSSPSFHVPRISALTPASDDSVFVSDIAAAALTRAFPSCGKPRRPKAGCAHNESILRPFVPAPMRALAWQTPYGTSFLASRRYLPAGDMARVRAEISNSLAKSSKSSYAAGPLRFTQYCDRNAIVKTGICMHSSHSNKRDNKS
ncbi:DNA breaking-rejoining enzyme [Mycena indigotica]|uniref:DNA breaking-rejoining enzyme n=1 Tax=Mycena indigotica TaxID=2126181 RepID=A0A8H6WF38_9AGAR|nr:DNA breaking-rejoining enzyme [Mycena indigotica]KAF7315437.1 DNA breaking-rejoining enzyme [Mycena indigotica]